MFRRGYIGTEHILLGLLWEEQGLAARVLGSFGVTHRQARERVKKMLGSGEEAVVPRKPFPFSPRAGRAVGLRST